MIKTYNITNVKKLIDLNEDTTNFDITFRVSSKNKESFDLLVVDQTTLDNVPNLEYKKVSDGEITGTVRNDSNEYQNYFLILKADKPCECEVQIDKQVISGSGTQGSGTQGNGAQGGGTQGGGTQGGIQENTPLMENSEQESYNPPEYSPPSSKQFSKPGDDINWVKIIFIVALVLLGIYVVYSYFVKKGAFGFGASNQNNQKDFQRSTSYALSEKSDTSNSHPKGRFEEPPKNDLANRLRKLKL
jgi:hypothetical protein